MAAPLHPTERADRATGRAAYRKAAAATRESLVQGALVQFLAVALPEAWVTAIPGGDGRQTRAVGYVSGTPDLVMIFRGRAFFIETKRPGKGAEKHQTACHVEIARAGAPTAVCRTVDELVAACREWGLPLRARVNA